MADCTDTNPQKPSVIFTLWMTTAVDTVMQPAGSVWLVSRRFASINNPVADQEIAKSMNRPLQLNRL